MMLFEFVLLSVRTGDFFMDILVPGFAGGVVLLLIGASLLRHWGFEIGF